MTDTDSHYWHLIHNTWVAGCNVCATIGYEHFDGYRKQWLIEFGPKPGQWSYPPPPPVNAIAEGSGRLGRGILP